MFSQWHTTGSAPAEMDFSSHNFEMPPALEDLPRITPFFFVPPLENKPQNPIMESLKLEKMNTNLPPRPVPLKQLPDELEALTQDFIQNGLESLSLNKGLLGSIKRDFYEHKQNGLLSWDKLRPSYRSGASRTPFISEQGDLLSTAVRTHAQPRLYDALDSTVHITQKMLLLSLKLTVLGLNSPYYVWEPSTERFVQNGGCGEKSKGNILIHGKDEIGSLLRRLEIFLAELREKSAREGPTVHALAHSISTSLDYIRDCITKCPPTVDDINANAGDFPLQEIWSRYAVYEELLGALTDLYGRSWEHIPDTYLLLDFTSIAILSRIYEHLSAHFDRQSSKVVRAVFAFILTNASKQYLQDVASSVGFGNQVSRRKSSRNTKGQNDFDMDEDEGQEEDLFELLGGIETSFPAFFPRKVLQILPAAQKSLVLLQIAKEDHPLLSNPTGNLSVRWLWSTDEIWASWNETPLPKISSPQSSACSVTSPTSTTRYPTEFLDFRKFDLEPGSATSGDFLKPESDSFLKLSRFVETFPDTLPPIAPTLSELTSLVFKDLMKHSSLLSSSLLSIYIDSPGILNFRSHLLILRSFLLLSLPSFKSRMLSALFSDAGEFGSEKSAHSLSINRRSKKSIKERTQPWAVGLSLDLLERETWPPVGSDLSFFLRTVIVDSLKSRPDIIEDQKRDLVLEEAAWRLGFAIRDLPTGSGRDKWLDPLCIESLDFLYMDYKPPRPLEILISYDILSKYQRMFTFILRLLRVECALKSLFRMSTHRTIADFLFPTLTQSRKLLLHFRFVAQAFVSSLSGYVYETAIGGNFEPFLERLSSDSDASNEGYNQFNDVFELADRHSAVLDDILSACLLRSGQRGVGDLLRHCLEIVLEFTIVVGELHRGRIQEYQAAPMIEELHQKFCAKMTALTRVLKGIVEKGPSSSSSPLFIAPSDGGHRPTGGLEALHHLLLRIDLRDWWNRPTA
ncbi:hypothetical protein D9613_000179 [Agrocybe pediades]|uniref:Spindle pole body component n=1 Tax=Agrocybe pediades TaxID=84607 RepID=A0A8H4VUH5_9AGAR|nr:hypothetical protein D9613_000179 [Agrocybe pediades]